MRSSTGMHILESEWSRNIYIVAGALPPSRNDSVGRFQRKDRESGAQRTGGIATLSERRRMDGGALNGCRIRPPCFRRLCGLSPRFLCGHSGYRGCSFIGSDQGWGCSTRSRWALLAPRVQTLNILPPAPVGAGDAEKRGTERVAKGRRISVDAGTHHPSCSSRLFREREPRGVYAAGVEIGPGLRAGCTGWLSISSGAMLAGS